MHRTVAPRLWAVTSVAPTSFHPLSGAELPRRCPFGAWKGFRDRGSLEGQVEAGPVTIPWPALAAGPLCAFSGASLLLAADTR